VSDSMSFDLEPLIRPMTTADIKGVTRIDRDAFDSYRRSQLQTTRSYPMRTPENMNAAVRRPHPGVVIEQPKGTLIGYCFTHVWGSLGWLGTLGITPRRQGFGFGRAVIAAGLETLREAGCTTLALETMPESGKNLALYTDLGMEARYLTFAYQGLPRPAAEVHYQTWEGGPALRQITGQIVPGMDPTPSAQWLADEEAGRTLVWSEDGQPTAFVALRHSSRRLKSMQEYLTVETAACVPEVADRWPDYLCEMSTYAKQLGKRGLIFPVNGRQIDLLRAMRALRMRIAYTRVRMVIGDWIGAPDDLLLLTLAM
jgi:ribosomal protein S18 acetylase RimI-like enzyme